MVTLHSIEGDEGIGYEFDPTSGGYRRVALPDGAQSHASGFADVRKVGLLHRTEVFAAIYSSDQMLHVAIPPQHFTWPGPYVAQRETLLDRIKSIKIQSQGHTDLSLRYTFIDSGHEFPGPEVMDIFWMIARKTRSLESVRQFIYFWTASARGKDVTTDDFQRRLASL